ncbi:toxic anion resistance protein [Bacillus sp. NPDC077027]|uniref:toxic anion resistance protein n=1 Tax=Bacillus sp. NPDC077027 TaxID=3390548 RepID=UPI003D00121D
MKPGDQKQSILSSTSDLRFRVIDTLSEEERREALQRVVKVPETRQKLLLYGTRLQQQLLDHSKQMMGYVEKQEIDQIGEVLETFLNQLGQVEPEDLILKKGGFFPKWFRRERRSVQEIVSRFKLSQSQIERLSAKLRYARNLLISDHKLLDRLYKQNQEFYQELTFQVAAAEEKLTQIERDVLPQFKHPKEQTLEEQFMNQEVDYFDYAERLKERIYDLMLSRQITLQCGAQIRMIQHTNHSLANHIHSTVTSSIPLWINQMSIALTHIQQRETAALQKRVNQAFEQASKDQELLRANVPSNHVEALKQVQYQLAEALQETFQLKEDGKQERAQVKNEMQEVEQHLVGIKPIQE